MYTKLTAEQRLGEILALRAKLKSTTALRVQVLAAVSEIYGRHGVAIDDDMLADLTIAIPEELQNTLAEVILPGGTNC